MGKISGLPDDVRQELIGYLAQPGIITNITAEVPAKKCAEFEEKYGVTPYPVNSEKKYGDQYRIYLADPDGCPEILKQALDQKYGRLNDTVFIRELVDEYGFSFFQPKQDTAIIQTKAKSRGTDGYLAFLKGFHASQDFMSALSSSVDNSSTVLPVITTVEETDKQKGKAQKKPQKHPLIGDSNAGLSEDQLLHLGWIGEQYLYNLLISHNSNLIAAFGISNPDEMTVSWFNDGFDSGSSWTDKSVGKGCDILIQDGPRNIFIEVKTSKRKSPVFAMTSFEMQTMQIQQKDYYIAKIDNIEKLIAGQSPDIRIFANPFEYFFVPNRMYSAIFYCN